MFRVINLTGGMSNVTSLVTIHISAGAGHETLILARQLFGSDSSPFLGGQKISPSIEGGEAIAMSPASENQSSLGIGVGPTGRFSHPSIHVNGGTQDSLGGITHSHIPRQKMNANHRKVAGHTTHRKALAISLPSRSGRLPVTKRISERTISGRPKNLMCAIVMISVNMVLIYPWIVVFALMPNLLHVAEKHFHDRWHHRPHNVDLQDA
jgi:hypothetical protein